MSGSATASELRAFADHFHNVPKSGEKSGKEITMSASILVGYATRYGSTQEVAGAVAATLRERGLEVDIQPLRDVRTLEGYRAIVLGAPLYMFHWHKDALRFLARHREALMQWPVAIFALGPLHAEEKEFQAAREQLEKELVKFPWLKPAAIAIFGGKFDPQKLTFPYNLIPALKNMPASDVRDWAAIRAWANDLVAQFQPALAELTK
jgi:menaquinone-dependent protoporphyrinogen oxidase